MSNPFNSRFVPAEHRRPHGGEQFIYRFSNGYGASVVRHRYSYGWSDGLWELAVLDGDNLCYTTPVTSDVEGYLSEEKVASLLEEIVSL